MFPVSIGRLWERLSSNGMGKGGHHTLRHYRNAPVSALFVQYRRHPGEVVQMDLRQSISLSHLPWSNASPGAPGTAERKGTDPRALLGEFKTITYLFPIFLIM